MKELSIEEKAIELASLLVGEDQNQQPLVDILIDMANWQKQQMMKDAVYGLVCGHDGDSPAWIDLNLLNKPDVKVGEEVKLIIVKDK